MVELRPATAEDAAHLADLQIAAWRAGFSKLLPADFELPPREAFLAGADSAMREPGVVKTVAEVEGRLAGFCTHGPSRDADAGPEVGEVRALFVGPEHWRRGVGTALVEHALERLREDGYAEVTVWSFRDNAAANALYERHGFRPDGATQARQPFAGTPEARYRRGL
jgi:RimJ/RimL family protein N-acetyltransferase